MLEPVSAVPVVSLAVSVLFVVSFVVADELAALEDVFFLEVVVPVEPVVPVPVVSAVLLSVDDVFFADELAVSVDELSDEESLLLSELLLDESELFLLLSLAFFESLEDMLLTSDELVLDTRVAPSFVFVTVLVTTLVAPRAKAIDTIANGVIKGGVRYPMRHSSFHLT